MALKTVVTMSIQPLVHDLATTSNKETVSQNSRVDASEFPEKLE